MLTGAMWTMHAIVKQLITETEYYGTDLSKSSRKNMAEINFMKK
jgi:hypothetical protein